jgi:hypothetical protein
VPSEGFKALLVDVSHTYASFKPFVSILPEHLPGTSQSLEKLFNGLTLLLLSVMLGQDQA